MNMDPLLQGFQDIFRGFSKLEDQCTIVTYLSGKPVVHPPCCLPLIALVEEKLSNMVDEQRKGLFGKNRMVDEQPAKVKCIL